MSTVLRHNARTLHFGPEPMTQAKAESEGNVFIRHPKTGEAITITPVRRAELPRGHALGPPPHKQESLFSDEEIKNPPHHSLSPHQFAAQHDVWWHGRYGEDLPSDSFREAHEHFPDHVPSDEDDRTGYQGIHFGTRKAAEDRLRHLGPGRAQDEYGSEGRIPGRFFPVTLNKQNMDTSTVHRDVGHDWRGHMGYDEPAGRGVLYENDAEDRGAVSATVPERYGRRGHFFKTWNDHVTEAHDAGASVHPMLLDFARQAPEHTGEDYVHPHEVEAAETAETPLFRVYNDRRINTKYLDRDYKDTLGPNIKVGKS